MKGRRTGAAIQEVRALAQATFNTACEIDERVNGATPDDTFVHIRARNIGDVKAEFQKGLADVLVVSFDTRDPVLAERVARAIKAELNKGA